MKRSRSITTRLALVYLLLLLLVALLGSFALGSLGYFNRTTATVRDRWLPSTGILAHLNNDTSDFRAAEGTSLLARDAGQLADNDAQIEDLDRKIESDQRNYRSIPQEAEEQSLFEQFADDWNTYKQIAGDVRAWLRNGERQRAMELYEGSSKRAYDAASDTLDILTSHSIASARQASTQEEVAFGHARRLIIATILFAALSVGTAMAYVSRSISVPILSLADSMHRLAANETAIEIAATDRGDEIGEMARAVVVFRRNAIELLNSQIGLEQRASMLREKLAEEQRLMLLQRNFVSMASHEFRTPITVIDGHAQMIQSIRHLPGGEAVAERARKIRNSVRRMTHLIENLIDSMRVMDGDVKLYFHPSRVDVAAVLQDAYQLQREIAPQAQILKSCSSTSLYAHADPHLLFQVISNLLSNAIKYSPAGGLIDLRLRSSGDTAIIEIQDRGIGIPEADRARVFDRYYRGGNTDGIVGTGIGLYFVRTVVELHGGTISVDSSEGAGSCFTLHLPLGMDRAQTALYKGQVSATL